MFRITRISYLVGLVMIVFGLAFNLASPAFASSSSAQNQDPSPTLTPHWVTGCHAEPPYSKSGPAKKYIEITIDLNGQRGLKDHYDHDNDIWPAPPGGCPVIAEDTETPTATATDTLEPPPTETLTATPTGTLAPTETETPTATATTAPQATETSTSTATATIAPQATETSTSTATATLAPQATETPTATATATNTLVVVVPTATATNTATSTSTATLRPTNTSTSTSTATEPPGVFVVNTSTTAPSRTPTATFEPFVFPNGNSPTPPPTITVAAQFIPVTGPAATATLTPPALSAAATVAPPASTEEAFLPVTGADQTQIPALPWGNLSMLLGLCIIGATAYFDGLFSYFLGKK